LGGCDSADPKGLNSKDKHKGMKESLLVSSFHTEVWI